MATTTATATEIDISMAATAATGHNLTAAAGAAAAGAAAAGCAAGAGAVVFPRATHEEATHAERSLLRLALERRMHVQFEVLIELGLSNLQAISVEIDLCKARRAAEKGYI